MSGVAEVDGDGAGVDGDVDRPESGAGVVAAVAGSFGNLAGEVHVATGDGAVVVVCCGDGEDQLAGAIQRSPFRCGAAGLGTGL